MKVYFNVSCKNNITLAVFQAVERIYIVHLNNLPRATPHLLGSSGSVVPPRGFGASAFAELRLRSATRPLTSGLRLTDFSSLSVGAASLRIPLGVHTKRDCFSSLFKLVPPRGFEPLSDG